MNQISGHAESIDNGLSISFDDTEQTESLFEEGNHGNTVTIRSSSSKFNNVLVITRLHEGMTVALITGWNFPLKTTYYDYCSVSEMVEKLAYSTDFEITELFKVKGTHHEGNFMHNATGLFSSLRHELGIPNNGGSL